MTPHDISCLCLRVNFVVVVDDCAGNILHQTVRHLHIGTCLRDHDSYRIKATIWCLHYAYIVNRGRRQTKDLSGPRFMREAPARGEP